MRRPKEPADKQDEAPPPGGRARKRIEQFNKARGIPDESTEAPRDETPDDAQKDTANPKPDR